MLPQQSNTYLGMVPHRISSSRGLTDRETQPYHPIEYSAHLIASCIAWGPFKGPPNDCLSVNALIQEPHQLTWLRALGSKFYRMTHATSRPQPNLWFHLASARGASPIEPLGAPRIRGGLQNLNSPSPKAFRSSCCWLRPRLVRGSGLQTQPDTFRFA